MLPGQVSAAGCSSAGSGAPRTRGSCSSTGIPRDLLHLLPQQRRGTCAHASPTAAVTLTLRQAQGQERRSLHHPSGTELSGCPEPSRGSPRLSQHPRARHEASHHDFQTRCGCVLPLTEPPTVPMHKPPPALMFCKAPPKGNLDSAKVEENRITTHSHGSNPGSRGSVSLTS